MPQVGTKRRAPSVAGDDDSWSPGHSDTEGGRSNAGSGTPGGVLAASRSGISADTGGEFDSYGGGGRGGKGGKGVGGGDHKKRAGGGDRGGRGGYGDSEDFNPPAKQEQVRYVDPAYETSKAAKKARGILTSALPQVFESYFGVTRWGTRGWARPGGIPAQPHVCICVAHWICMRGGGSSAGGRGSTCSRQCVESSYGGQASKKEKSCLLQFLRLCRAYI
jgi:hypothetical protein